MRKKRYLAAVLVPLVIASSAVAAAERREANGREAVAQAVYDYVDALYQVDPSRVARSVHPQLTKVGFYKSRGERTYTQAQMTYGELEALAGRWNRAGRVNPQTAPRQVVVLDVLDQTASAKLVADWGVDYLHLARFDGRWKIVNVMWQSPPPTTAR